MNYALRRLGRAVLLLVATSVFCFVLTEAAPGSFFDEMRLDPRVSAETVEGLRAQYGLDRPLVVRYGLWLKSVARGEFGYSFAYHAPVLPLLVGRGRNTLLLTLLATLLAWLIALPLGIWTAVGGGRWPDRTTAFGTSLLLSVPEIGLVLAALALAARTRLLPAGGLTSPSFNELSTGGKAMDVFSHWLIPGGVLALGIVAIVVRHVRSSVREVLDAPYIEAARAHGIAGGRLLWRHALPAAANAMISLFGLSLAALLSGSLAVEVITGWPGLGPLVLEATLARDPYVIIGAVMLSAALVIVATLVSDLLLLWVDPRISLRSADA